MPKPAEGSLLDRIGDNPFAFGGGYKNGGLTQEAMDLLHPILRFDYMGAAEFEFGEVPKAFNKMTKMKLVAWTVQLVVEGQICPIFFICNERDKEEVEARVLQFAREDWNADLKEDTHLKRTIKELGESGPDMHQCVGWLELNNGFMFFIDQEMWEKSVNLFDVKVID